MAKTAELVPAERIQSRILVLRGQRVLADADSAVIHEVPTKQLNQAVKRNSGRFPEDFMFQLTEEEVAHVRLNPQNDALSKRSQVVAGPQKHRAPRYFPFAFTEHGAIQLSNILRSDRVIELGIAFVRAFVQPRALMVDHKTLRAKLAELNARIGAFDEQLAAIIEAIREVAVPVESPDKRKIGYHLGNQ